MFLSMLWRLCNTALFLRKHPMPFTGLATQGSKSSHMYLMVMCFLCVEHSCFWCIYSSHPDFFTHSNILYSCISPKYSHVYVFPLSFNTNRTCSSCSVIRASVPKMNLDDAFEQKNEIAKAVEDELEKAMSMYGYEIVQTLIVDIEPDEHVKRAMNEINAAARLRMAANEKAEAEKILQIKRAEGEAESKYLAGVGIARQRQAIVDGLRDSVLAFSENVPGTSAKDVMDMVLVTQYFDTMKEIGASSKSSSVFIPHGPGAVKDIAAQIRDGQLQARLL
ncbi:hypothetical protein GUJ93_ZPchr0008g12663 [Zizania palustris]|uniref:Band 7 domain-containing protein n=1 Tax=Zizania palustris TaxID=103762 RepID=A0A8J5QZ76_ZIZPA|nr:hypothetical protein GUJ93_ZPchr0008g12663 [Zizania palustris]